MHPQVAFDLNLGSTGDLHQLQLTLQQASGFGTLLVCDDYNFSSSRLYIEDKYVTAFDDCMPSSHLLVQVCVLLLATSVRDHQHDADGP